jgi:hypothetical protein
MTYTEIKDKYWWEWLRKCRATLDDPIFKDAYNVKCLDEAYFWDWIIKVKLTKELLDDYE